MPKISELTNITGANLADNDEFVVVDTDAGVTKAVTRAEFFKDTPNVGIGTSAPQSELDVFGVGDIIRSTSNNASSNFMAFFDATGRKGYFGYGGTTEDMTLYNERSGFLRFGTNGSTRMQITSSGDLGIGTTSPTERLHVSGNIIASGTSSTTKNILRTTSGQIEVRAGDTASFIDTDFTEATSVAVAVRFFRNTNTTGARTVRFHRGDGTATEDARIAVGTENTFFGMGGGSVGIGTTSPSEKLDVVGNVTISGSLSKGSGSFKIDHPLKPDTHYLVHSFLEGPQADNIYRGKVTLVDGTAIVNLDEAARMTEGTFAALNGNIQCFTSNESGWTAVRGSVVGNILTIEAQDATCTDEVSWLVIGERIDQHMLETSWTDDAGRIITEPEKPQETLEE